MKQVITILLFMMPLLVNAKIDEQKLFERVDHTLEMDGQYKKNKENSIKRLKRLANDATNNQQKLVYLDSIYKAYSTYRYDSASEYVAKGLQLAETTNNDFFIVKNKINRASILSVGGFYSQSETILESIDPNQLPHRLMMYYYFTYAWLYNYWASFCANSEFAKEYQDKKKHYIQLLLQKANSEERKKAEYFYLKGEYIYIEHPTHKNVLINFLRAVKIAPKNTRTHAAAAYGVARYYQDIERYDLYEQYLVEASESDGICQLMETLALQKLAYFIYHKDEKYSKLAAKYIKHSMADAQFFNNRLRMIEISNILPVIIASNQQAAERSRTRLQTGLIAVGVILIGVLILAVINIKQKNHLRKQREEIAHQNEQLAELNQRLVLTNKRRETYMRLFMDISALYIKKLDDYRKLVSRKIKARQTEDLLKSINSFKLAEDESKMFYIRFDKAFLELYPDFVKELNKLLTPENQISLPSSNELTTEVRIYALMRLGVTDSQEIATLLYYSTQTIYNYKSGMRAKAKNRETFESEINRLCHLI